MIPTATGDNAEYIAKFYAAYSSLDARPAHLPFFHRTPDLRALVLAQDVIFVGGGNTKSMLAVWKEWELPEILREASASGRRHGRRQRRRDLLVRARRHRFVGRSPPLACLGWLRGSCCPHYDGEVERRPAYHALLGEGQIKPGYAIEDGVAAHFRNGELAAVVSKREGARAYHVSLSDGRVHEKPLETLVLPAC